METTNNNVRTEKRKFRLYEHPWLSLLAFMVITVFSIALTGTVIFGWIGLFYGYVFVRTRSLLPSMIVHCWQ